MFPSAEMNELILVETMAGLCSYSHTPALRNQTISSDSKLIDRIALENMTGSLDGAGVREFAPHLSGMTTSPMAQSQIRGGFDEYNKGMMKLLFRVGKENFITEYLHVLGFITENDLEFGVSENAVFVPVCSWRESQQVKGAVDRHGRATVSSQLSRRNDYVFNDGSLDQYAGWTTIRPSDVLSGISNTLNSAKVLDTLAENYGTDRGSINLGEATTSLALNSVISKRGNINPTLYSNELLGSIVKTNNDMGGNRLDNRLTSQIGDVNETDYYQSTASYSGSRETKFYDDPFLMAVLEGQNPAAYRGTRIRDLMHIYPNFLDTIPAEGFITLDYTRHPVIDYREISRIFGTSTIAETIAYEVVFNILDTITLHGLGIFHCIGSNCERNAGGHIRRTDDHRMSNIEVIPTHYVGLADNDVEIHRSANDACEDITNQIMNKLNGMSYHVATPVRFEIKSELLGMTELAIALPTDEDPTPRFMEWSFPTYAFSRFSPILTHMDGHKRMCDGVYKNLSSYLKGTVR